jgi:hypothetical protein
VNDLGINGWGDSGLQDNKERRNGSMVVMSVGSTQGYDSRGFTYERSASVTFPYELPANRSLISSISEVTVPNTVIHADLMWKSERLLHGHRGARVAHQEAPGSASNTATRARRVYEMSSWTTPLVGHLHKKEANRRMHDLPPLAAWLLRAMRCEAGTTVSRTR